MGLCFRWDCSWYVRSHGFGGELRYCSGPIHLLGEGMLVCRWVIKIFGIVLLLGAAMFCDEFVVRTKALLR